MQQQRLSVWLFVSALLLSLLCCPSTYGALTGISRVRDSTSFAGNAPLPDLYEATITELQDGLEKGLFTTVDLVTVGVTVLTCISV